MQVCFKWFYALWEIPVLFSTKEKNWFTSEVAKNKCIKQVCLRKFQKKHLKKLKALIETFERKKINNPKLTVIFFSKCIYNEKGRVDKMGGSNSRKSELCE